MTTKSEQLAQDIANTAHSIHGTDKDAAKAMISEVVAGEGTWRASMIGLATCLYLMKLEKAA
jgi:hypothetical protein